MDSRSGTREALLRKIKAYFYSTFSAIEDPGFKRTFARGSNAIPVVPRAPSVALEQMRLFPAVKISSSHRFPGFVQLPSSSAAPSGPLQQNSSNAPKPNRTMPQSLSLNQAMPRIPLDSQAIPQSQPHNLAMAEIPLHKQGLQHRR